MDGTKESQCFAGCAGIVGKDRRETVCSGCGKGLIRGLSEGQEEEVVGLVPVGRVSSSDDGPVGKPIRSRPPLSPLKGT